MSKGPEWKSSLVMWVASMILDIEGFTRPAYSDGTEAYVPLKSHKCLACEYRGISKGDGVLS